MFLDFEACLAESFIGALIIILLLLIGFFVFFFWFWGKKKVESLKVTKLYGPIKNFSFSSPTHFDIRETEGTKNCVSFSSYLASLKLHRDLTPARLLSELTEKLIHFPLPPLGLFLPDSLKHQIQLPDLLSGIFCLLSPALVTHLFDTYTVLCKSFGGKIQNIVTLKYIKDDNFVLSNLDRIIDDSSVNLNEDDVSQPFALDNDILPDLFLGWGNNSLNCDMKTSRRNVIVAEIVSRLYPTTFASETDITDAFTITMSDGTQITRVDDFFSFLKNAGCKLTAHIVLTSAVFGVGLCTPKEDYINNKTKTTPIKYYNIPFGLFFRTPVTDDLLNDISIPSTHAGLVISCRGVLPPTGISMDFDLQYYLGNEGRTRFYPDNYHIMDWNTGRVVNLDSDPVDVALTASWTGHLFNTLADKQSLFKGGYGAIGMCIDSVAPVQKALTGSTTLWPISTPSKYRSALCKMCSKLTEDNLKEKLVQSSDKKILQNLNNAWKTIPSDLEMPLGPENVNTLKRIISSIPWNRGEEPYQSTYEAREILEATIKKYNE